VCVCICVRVCVYTSYSGVHTYCSCTARHRWVGWDVEKSLPPVMDVLVVQLLWGERQPACKCEKQTEGVCVCVRVCVCVCVCELTAE